MIPAYGLSKERAPHGPRVGKGNLFSADGKPLLVIVEGSDGDRMLAKGMEALGGLESLVALGEGMYLKPNYGSHRDYPTGSDPHFLVSIARQWRQSGGTGVTICDSSDAYVLNRYNDHEYVFKVNQMFDIGKAADIEVICTHPKEETEYIPVRSGKWVANSEIKVNRRFLSAPVIINQPMLKRHGEAHMTCALKNFFGAVFQPQRKHAHDRLHGNAVKGEDFFMRTIAEFADALRPELTIVDARKIMTRRGPSLKEGSVIVDAHRLIISGDLVATDAYCAQLLADHDDTFHQETILKTLEYAQSLGLGTRDLTQVNIVEVST
ncbi:MAG: DUF362 domain-containing protein [Fidelibacterota bacterium]|nr:MAG: DUF362 domain-containing protein [Candidatus Neomarinimicrobiota bacterium]